MPSRRRDGMAETRALQDAGTAGGVAGLVAGVVGGAKIGLIGIPIPWVGPFVGAVVGGVVGSGLGRLVGDGLVVAGDAIVRGAKAGTAMLSDAAER
jgi:hypothetical protein